jgi:hypothetical protein
MLLDSVDIFGILSIFRKSESCRILLQIDEYSSYETIHYSTKSMSDSRKSNVGNFICVTDVTRRRGSCKAEVKEVMFEPVDVFNF